MSVKVLTPYFELLKDIKSSLENQASIIVEQNKQEILDYNTKEQLFKKGIDSKGSKIVPAYAKSTKKRKRKKGLPSNRVTLFDSGKHHKTFDLKVKGREMIIQSNTITSKGFNLSSHLNDSYGGNTEGLTDKNNQTVNDEIIEPKLYEWIYQKLSK